MKLTCLKTYAHHYGSYLTQGKEYEISKPFWEMTRFVTDYDNYFKMTVSISESFKMIKDFLNLTDNEKELIKNINEKNKVDSLTRNKLYCKTIELPYVKVINTDMNSEFTFVVPTREEMIHYYGADTGKGRNNIWFETTKYHIDDYFDYYSQRRDIKLKELLK